MERAFRPGYLSGLADRAVLDFVVLTAGFIPLLAVCAWPYVKGVAIGHVVGGAFLILYSILLLLVVGRFAIKSPGLLTRAWRGDQAARSELKEELKGVGAGTLLAGFIFSFALTKLGQVRDIVLSGVIWLLMVSYVVRGHARLLAGVKAVTERKIVRRAALIGPIVIPSALFIALLFTRIRSTGELFGAVTSMFGMYVIALFLSRGFVWLISRSRRKSSK